MKNIVRYLINITVRITILFGPYLSSINIIRQYYYSRLYCAIFKCKNCVFLRKVNTIKGAQYFEIGDGCCFGKEVVLTAWDSYEGERFSPTVKIGPRCNFGDFLHLTSINKITIGANVLTGRWVTITDNGHGTINDALISIPPISRKLYSKDAITIGDNVWIGDKVSILPGVSIGDGCIIGANSVVTKNFPPYSVVAGNPAEVVTKNIK